MSSPVTERRVRVNVNPKNLRTLACEQHRHRLAIPPTGPNGARSGDNGDFPSQIKHPVLPPTHTANLDDKEPRIEIALPNEKGLLHNAAREDYLSCSRVPIINLPSHGKIPPLRRVSTVVFLPPNPSIHQREEHRNLRCTPPVSAVHRPPRTGALDAFHGED